MRTVLVTGGAGFIGSHLVDQLLEGGAAVRVLDNLSTGSLLNLQAAAERHSREGAVVNGGRLEVVIGDVRDRGAVRKALRNVKYVFHLAALPASSVAGKESADVHAVNVEGTLNLLHGALTEGVWRIVLASCASVYGVPDAAPVGEDAPLRPTTLFGASKVAAETYCQAFQARHQLETVILRYFNVYGPRQKAVPGGPILPNLLEAVRQRRRLVDYPNTGTYDFIYVDDAVAAALAAVRAPRATGHAVNIGSGQITSIDGVVRILSDLLRISHVPGFMKSSEVEPRHIAAEMSRALKLLDFSARTSLVAGLARLVRVLSEAEQPDYPALAPVGLDD
jgi:UDP-glucose 4-epimerase